MNWRLWDYQCSCGKEYRDWPVNGARVPKTIKCECGKRAGWVRMRKNQIHRSHSSQYGRMDPRLGERVDSYEEKKRLLKERGLEETDIERYDDIQQDVINRSKKDDTPTNHIVADSLDEIMDSIKTDQVDWRHTGNLRGRAGQDPETLLIGGMKGF